MKFDRITAMHYDALSRWGKPPDGANRERIVKTIALIPKEVRTILDVGCGDGMISNPLVAKGLDVTGADISTEALQYFRGKRKVVNIERLPFQDNSFDIVICAEVLEHLQVKVYHKVLTEIERTARHYIIVTILNQEYLPEGFVKCESCGCTYHKNLHVRTFDQSVHAVLFSEFELVKTVEIAEWRQDRPLMASLKTAFGVYAYKDGLICPYCGHNGVEKSRPGFVKKVVLKVVRLSDRYVRSCCKARWIASLYRRSGTACRPEGCL